MKRFLAFVLLNMFPLTVWAGLDVNTVKDYQTCLDFQNSYSSSNFSQGYYGHCVQATCYGGEWKTSFYTEGLVKCYNGNTDPIYTVAKSTCTKYYGSCNSTAYPSYCGILASYDCSRTSNGLPYKPSSTKPVTTTTTTKKRTTTRRQPGTTTMTTTTTTTTTTTVSAKDSNNYLRELTLEDVDFTFSRDVETYNIRVSEDTKNIKVRAIAESDKATVKISNNENINSNLPIEVMVTAEDGSLRIYKINISFEDVLDDNNRLAKLEVSGYNLSFDSNTYDYKLKIKKKVKSLDILVETLSETATYEIKNNENLKNNSQITITVTAENGDELNYNILIKKSSNFGLVVIIILVLGAAGYAVYRLVINLPRDKDDEGYDYE